MYKLQSFDMDELETCIVEDHLQKEFTDVMYTILFGKTIDQMKSELGIGMFTPLRDHFSSETLVLIADVERASSETIQYVNAQGKYAIMGVIKNVSEAFKPVAEDLMKRGIVYQ